MDEEVNPILKNLVEFLSDQTAATQVLISDLNEAVVPLRQTSTPQQRRSYVRSFFAYVEGSSWGMQRFLLEAHVGFGNLLTGAEAAVLLDESYILTRDGKVESKLQRHALTNKLRFTLATGDRVFGTPLGVRYDDQGWKAFRHCLDLRNRLTHPTTSDDLFVSDVDLEEMEGATVWFRDAYQAFLRAASEAIGRGAVALRTQENVATMKAAPRTTAEEE
jgi:hypothetical protein